MSAVATLIGTLLAFAGSCWLLKDLFVKSPLDNVPGPPSPSFLKGILSYILFLLTN